jgi:hypothetical protein
LLALLCMISDFEIVWFSVYFKLISWFLNLISESSVEDFCHDDGPLGSRSLDNFSSCLARLEGLEIVRKRFQKFNSKYIECIKNMCGRSSARGAENAVWLHARTYIWCQLTQPLPRWGPVACFLIGMQCKIGLIWTLNRP